MSAKNERVRMKAQKEYLHGILLGLRKKLKKVGLETYVVSEATTGSCYLRFKGPEGMGGIRIGDHDERAKYGYRWQIRSDISHPYSDTSKGHTRYFYQACNLDSAVRHMRNYANAIQRRRAYELHDDTSSRGPVPGSSLPPLIPESEGIRVP